MDKDVRVRIKIDSETAKLDTLNSKVNSVGNSFNKTDSMALTFLSRLSFGAGAIGGLYLVIDTLSEIKDRGFEVNKTMQTLTNSLTTSSAVMIANTDIYGNAISISEKYRLATIDAARTTQLLQKANLKTPHTLDQTVKLYDSMYIGMRRLGATTQDLVEITEKLSIAVGNKVGFDAILSAMDGLANGTVEANSEMGRFLNSMGLGNDVIKNSSDVVQLFKDKLSDFQAISDYNTKMSNLSNSTDMFAKNLTKVPFSWWEGKLNSVAAVIDRMNDGLVRTIVRLSDVSDLSEKNDLILKRQQLLTERKDVQNDKFMWDSEQKEKIKEINSELSLLSSKLTQIYTDEEKLNNTKLAFDSTPIDKMVNDTLNPYGAKLDEINKKWQSHFEDMQKNGGDTSGVYKAWTKDIADLDKEFADKNKKISDSAEKEANKQKKLVDELSKAYSDIAQIGMSDYNKSLISITEKTENWKKAGVSNNEILAAQSKLLDELNSKTAIANTKEDLSYYERLIQLKSDSLQKDQELAGISYSQKVLDIQDTNRPIEEKEKLISLESELYSKTLERISLEYQANKLDEVSNSYQDMLDSQISLIDATNDWNSNLTGTAASLADIASATTNLSKLNLTNLKSEDKLRTEYEKNKLKFYDNEEKQKELDLKYAKDKATLDDKNLSATLIGFSNISAAVSTLFDQGSKEAAISQIAQSSLALVEGTRAILVAGTGDPYTAIPRMLSMAAMVSSLFKNIGVAFGMNTTSTYSDSFSSMTANTGTGTVLGDAAAQSESITNSLNILEDFAQPQYATLLSMNNYLEAIANNIGGVTSLLIQQGGFAFGDGYVGFDTGFKNNIGLNDITLGLMNPINSIISKIPIIGQINSLFGSVVNSVLGGVFGKTKTYQSLKDSGIYFANQLLTRAINDFNGSAYQTIETTVTKKSWFSSSSTTYLNTYFQALDNETERQFSLVLGNLYNTVLTAGVALDSTEAQTANSLKNFVVSIGKISLKGKSGDQIQETLESIFGSIGDKIALKAFPALVPFQQVGEGMFETLTRVATGMEEAEYYIGRLGNRFDDVIYTAIGNKQGDVGFEALLLSIENVEKATYPVNNNLLDIVENLDITAEELYTVYTSLDELRDRLIFLGLEAQGLSSSMIYGAGTITDLQSGFKAYFENFLTDDEQLAYKTEQLTQKFNDLGLALPNSNIGFKDLLLSIDETTQSGQELFGRLIVLSDEFAQVSSLRVDALQKELDITNGTISNIKEISNSLDNVISNLRSGLDNSSTNLLDKFNRSMNDSLLLSAGTDYTSLAASLKNTIDLSSALNNSDYFGSLSEMQYAQSVAANQFESMNINLDTELSVLQEIANNTNDMIAALSNLTTAVNNLQESSATTASNTAESRYIS
ncbi:MAG: hypothetical protein AB7D41_03595 [Arcobacter sp.]|uniref:hypothetical protein n=1 Tax=Arcobacter sp. TaxID=1872629 RepID=UPI003D019EC4